MANPGGNARIQTEIPGPKGRELAERRAHYVARGISTAVPTFAAQGKGALLEDVDGNRYIDFAGGIGVLNVGHANPEVVGAVKEQADRFLHTCFSVMMYDSYIDLAQKLTEITPGSFDKKAILLSAGAEAVENAVKIARYATKRPGIITFDGAFHGRTSLTMTMTGKVHPYKYDLGPASPEIYPVPAPYCYRCPCHLEHPSCGAECLSLLQLALKSRISPDRVAAVFIEPVLGEGGFIVPPVEYLKGLRELCTEHGILLVADEVQSGFARTGKMFAIEHSDVEPDLITMAKSLGAGIPLSAVVGRAELMDAPHPGALGGTYAGNPLGCAAALKVIEIMERDNYPARAEALGKVLRSRFEAMYERYPIIGDVRGLGAMMALELVRDRKTKEPADKETGAILKEAYGRGLITIRAGIYDNIIRVLVPLVADEAQIHEGLDILEDSIKAVAN